MFTDLWSSSAESIPSLHPNIGKIPHISELQRIVHLLSTSIEAFICGKIVFHRQNYKK